MPVKVTGQRELERQLERKLGNQAMKRISDRALKAGAKVFERELRKQLETFKNTGATLNELTFTEPRDIKGVRTITAHWKGPKNRYRVAHLNEFGTVNNPNPRGKGAIARALRNSESAYRKAIKKEVAKL